MAKSLGIEVYNYWFGKLESSQHYIDSRLDLWFLKSRSKDLETKKLFLDELINFSSYETSLPKEALGQIILLDQIPRNIFRDTSWAFAWDHRALELMKKCLSVNLDSGLSEIEKFFFYLPFQHQEDFFCQEESMRLIVPLKNTCADGFKKFFTFAEDFAIRHMEAIKKFGRFPHRNEILGRKSSMKELAFLSDKKNYF